VVAKGAHLVASQLGSLTWHLQACGYHLPNTGLVSTARAEGTRSTRTSWVWCSSCQVTAAEVCGGRGRVVLMHSTFPL